VASPATLDLVIATVVLMMDANLTYLVIFQTAEDVGTSTLRMVVSMSARPVPAMLPAILSSETAMTTPEIAVKSTSRLMKAIVVDVG
jgi:hypothetical protein